MKTTYICLHDAILKEYLLEIGLSKKYCRKVKLYGKMYVNDIEVKNYFLVKKNDIITLEYNEKENDEIIVNNREDIEIVYEDSHILVVNKKESLSSQPSRKHYEDNLISIMKKYFQDNHIISNIHLVNRLDFQTSGLIVIAKDGLTHYHLTKNSVEKTIKRKYLAIIDGYMNEKNGVIDLPIKRAAADGSTIKRMVSSDGKVAKTIYQVIKEKDGKSLVDIQLLTGRTHQIRVHFSYLNHPIVGDKLYGKKDKRLYLHCYYVEFLNPYTNEEIKITKYDDSFSDYFQIN